MQITFEQLLDYATGALTPDQKARLEAQLACDPRAAAEMDRIRDTLDLLRSDTSVQPPFELVQAAKAIFQRKPVTAGGNWWETLRQSVAALVHDSRVQPALAGYRGAEESFQLAFDADGFEVDVRIGAPEPNGQRRLIGQVSAAGDQPAQSVALLRIGEREPLAQTTLDDSGVFTLEATDGTYDLLVRAGDQVVSLSNIRIG